MLTWLREKTAPDVLPSRTVKLELEKRYHKALQARGEIADQIEHILNFWIQRGRPQRMGTRWIPNAVDMVTVRCQLPKRLADEVAKIDPHGYPADITELVRFYFKEKVY